mgnify:FL=1
MVKTIIFDYDGTIHNTLGIYEPAFREAYQWLSEQNVVEEQKIETAQIAGWLGLNSKEMWDTFLPELMKRLAEKNVEVHGDEKLMQIAEEGCMKKELLVPATEEDWGREYLDYKLSAKTVSSIDEAIAHINQYNTGHSEAIITNNYSNAEKFLNEIDAACVYVNASTRFTDGFEFGFGAEIGISTQKLHARGPMGLIALTSTKYIIYGNGQIRK